MSDKYKILPVDKIADPARPLRDDITPESLKDLAESIKKVGIIEPLVVNRTEKGYQLIAGQRRLMAAELLHLTKVPCIIITADEAKSEILKLHENFARLEISPLQCAKYLHNLKQQYNMTTDKLAELIGMSTSWVEQRLSIINYPERLKAALARSEIAFTAARELANIENPKTREIYINHAIKGGVTPGLAARWRREANSQKPYNPKPDQEKTSLETPPPPTVDDPLCPVCNQPIPFEEQLTLTIHAHCQPQPNND